MNSECPLEIQTNLFFSQEKRPFGHVEGSHSFTKGVKVQWCRLHLPFCTGWTQTWWCTKEEQAPRWNSTIAFPPRWANNHRLRGTDFNARMKCKSSYLLLKDHLPFFLKIRIFSNIEQGKLVWGSVWRLRAFNGKVQKFQKSVLFHLRKLYAFNFTYLFFIYFASDQHFFGNNT